MQFFRVTKSFWKICKPFYNVTLIFILYNFGEERGQKLKIIDRIGLSIPNILFLPKIEIFVGGRLHNNFKLFPNSFRRKFSLIFSMTDGLKTSDNRRPASTAYYYYFKHIKTNRLSKNIFFFINNQGALSADKIKTKRKTP